jgi:hypothetical protein
MNAEMGCTSSMYDPTRMPIVVKRISAIPFRFGGVEHSGWLPSNAAKPPPTPVEDWLLDLEIIEEAGGFMLCWSSLDGTHCGDLWFEKVEDAERQAERDFGISKGAWQNNTATT